MSSHYLSLFIAISGMVAAASIYKRPAPYGRFRSNRRVYGYHMNVRAAWVIMELPSLVVALGLLFSWSIRTGGRLSIEALVLCGIWIVHYVHRVFIYPLSLRVRYENSHRLALVSIAFLMNGVIAFALIDSILSNQQSYDGDLSSGRFVVGLSLCAFGFVLAKRSDAKLASLRNDGDSPDYSIPTGGVFRFVSSPNYLGEIVQWLGLAIAALTVPAFAFLFFCLCNLVPRAMSNHRWYRRRFQHEYPEDRKILVPLVW